MNKNRVLTLVALASVALALVLAGVYAGGPSVSLGDLPDAVSKTIAEYAAGGEILEIELETEGDETFYEIEIKKDGRIADLMVSLTGEYLGFDSEDDDDEDADDDEDEDGDEEEEVAIALTAAPEMVQTAAKKILGGAGVTEVTLESDDGVAIYEVSYEIADVSHSVKLTAAGDIIEMEWSMAPDALPVAVQTSLKNRFPGAKIAAAEVAQAMSYEIELVVDGKTIEVEVSPTGAIKGDDDEEDEDEDVDVDDDDGDDDGDGDGEHGHQDDDDDDN